jgi:hypothetical protein
MMGTEKFLQHFEEASNLNPARFLYTDGSGSLDVVKANIKKLKLRHIVCFHGRKKEYLCIPVGYTRLAILALLLSGSHKPKLNHFHKRFIRLKFNWLQGSITPVALDDLLLYVPHPYKTNFLVNILQGTTKIELPIKNKVIEIYTQAGIIPVEGYAR